MKFMLAFSGSLMPHGIYVSVRRLSAEKSSPYYSPNHSPSEYRQHRFTSVHPNLLPHTQLLLHHLYHGIWHGINSAFIDGITHHPLAPSGVPSFHHHCVLSISYIHAILHHHAVMYVAVPQQRVRSHSLHRHHLLRLTSAQQAQREPRRHDNQYNHQVPSRFPIIFIVMMSSIIFTHTFFLSFLVTLCTLWHLCCQQVPCKRRSASFVRFPRHPSLPPSLPVS